MSVVQLDTRFFGEVLPGELSASIFCVNSMPSHDVLECRRDQQILLLEPQLLSCISRIIRVKHTGDVLCSLPGFQGIKVFSFVESIEIELVKG